MIHAGNSLTKRTSHLLKEAQQEATRRHHLYVGPEHLLLALLAQRRGLTPQMFHRRVMISARGEMERLSHRFVGTEHVLLGLVSEDAGAIGELLRKQGLSKQGL